MSQLNNLQQKHYLNDKVMPQSFGTRDRERGQLLFQMNAVDQNSIEQGEYYLSAHVKSQNSRTIYYTELALPSEGKHYFESDCSCPVGTDCKHGAALAYFYMEYMLAGKENKPPSHVSDAEINLWLSDLTQKPKSTKTLLYVLHESHVGLGFKIEVHEGRALKSGAWSKNSPKTYLSSLNYHNIDDQDLLVVSLLKKECDYKQTVRSGHVLQQLVATGRCFLNSIDCALQWSDSIPLEWHWSVVDDQSQMLQARLVAEEEQLSLWPTVPITYFNARSQQIGYVTQDYPEYIASQLLTLPIVSNQQASWVEKRVNRQLSAGQKIVKPIARGEDVMVEGTPCLRIVESNDWSGQPEIQALLHFDYQGEQVFIDVLKNEYTYTQNGQTKTAYRDRDDEQEKLKTLQQLGLYTPTHYDQVGQAAPRILILKKHSQWYPLIHRNFESLKQQGWRIELDDSLPFDMVQPDQPMTAELESIDNDYFAVAMKVQLSGKSFDAFPVIKSALEQLPRSALADLDNISSNDQDKVVYVEIDSEPDEKVEQQEDNKSAAEEESKRLLLMERRKPLSRKQAKKTKKHIWPLALTDMRPILKQFIELLAPKQLNQSGQLKLSKIQSHQTLEQLEQQNIQFSGAESLQQFANKIRNFAGIESVELPKGLKAQLRDYQHHGVNWLQFLREYELAGILADDMGLGKTLQTLCHLLIEKEQGRLKEPALIVAPTSVVFNWGKEVEKFTPDLRCLTVQGTQKQRAKLLEKADDYDVVVTSYPLVQRDIEALRSQPFYMLILDEAQTIKNAKTKLYQSIQQIGSRFRLSLTGTPIENHLGELWAQFNFLLPGFLGGEQQFNQLFRKPIEREANQERSQLLKQRVQPFILRRTKQNIAKELPEKTEIVQMIPMEGKQATLYEAMRLSMNENLRKLIDAKGLECSKIEVLDAMLKLRQVCCHPQLLPLEKSNGVTQSVKLDILIDMVTELVEESRKVLIFSQFTSMLDLIKPVLESQHIDYVELTGQTKKRQQVVEKFEQTNIPVFLISLKAGGVGLNLTAADTVIHFDPWWNPAAENQATDRAYRIGQDKPVFVYKLLIENSIEQKIHQLQQQKSALVDNLLSEQTGAGKLELTESSIEELFQPLSRT